ncbi:hypothetical protein [Methylobacterium sp. Leaf108]|uniref:hypothetical protein n=1 Tax=Methylobacterium sp. Leaf108 TaxID=1736256 RepID=UPI0012E7448E|nr:hypothetical protein [Methylobacterium sp. Leaf108]
MLLQVPQLGGAYRAGPVRIGQRHVLSFAETATSNEDRVSFLIRLIRFGTRRLDLMLRPHGPAPAVPLTVHVFALADGRTDAIALDDMLATCQRRPR